MVTRSFSQTNRLVWRGCQSSRGNSLLLRTEGSPRFTLLAPTTDRGVAFCRTRVWGNALRGAEKGHACGSENGAAMLDGPILAGLGGLPAGAMEGNEGYGRRHSSFLPSKRQHPGRSHGSLPGSRRTAKPATQGRVEIFSFDIWGRWCETRGQSPR